MIDFDCQFSWPGFDFAVAFRTGPGLTALFGPSGSGKTTVIRLLAGLERPRQGRIAVGDSILLDTRSRIDLPPHRRRIGMVFQDAQLFPHLSVRNNLRYGAWFTPRRERRIGMGPVVDVLGIGHLLDRRPGRLSGGERQRVAIGRALLTSPRLLLMDEPLAALDADRKLEILPFIERLRDEFAIPIVYVSHAAEEVARLAASVVRLDAGHVAAIGTPAEVMAPLGLGHPSDRFDAVSFLNGTVARYLPEYGVTLMAHPAGEIVLPGRIDAAGRNLRIAVRATNVTLAPGDPGMLSVRTVLRGTVRMIATDTGPFALVAADLPGGDSLLAYVTRLALNDLHLRVGDPVRLLIKAVAIDERGIPGMHLQERNI